MVRFSSILAAVFLLGWPAFGQEPVQLRFAFAANQSLAYKVDQTTTVNETTLDENTKKPVAISTNTKLTLSKKWLVKDVDPNGTATLEMTMTSMKQVTTQTIGSEKPVVNTLDSSKPEDAKAMTFLNKPILTLKLSPLGGVSEVKSELAGAADRLAVDLPFKVLFSSKAVKEDDFWERSIELKLPPPLGTGEKFDAVQRYIYFGVKVGDHKVAVVNELKKPLTDKSLLPGVAPMLWSGNAFFDPKTGTYKGAAMSIRQEAENHQGPGTKFSYASDYTEVVEK